MDRFHTYHEAAYLDEYRQHHIPISVDLVILTGRPVRYSDITTRWLAEVAHVKTLHIIHRNNDDARSSVDVKRDQLRWLLDPNLTYGVRRQQIVGAFDDREDIVRMYREEFGIPSHIVRIGDEEHAHG